MCVCVCMLNKLQATVSYDRSHSSSPICNLFIFEIIVILLNDRFSNTAHRHIERWNDRLRKSVSTVRATCVSCDHFQLSLQCILMLDLEHNLYFKMRRRKKRKNKIKSRWTARRERAKRDLSNFFFRLSLFCLIWWSVRLRDGKKQEQNVWSLLPASTYSSFLPLLLHFFPSHFLVFHFWHCPRSWSRHAQHFPL